MYGTDLSGGGGGGVEDGGERVRVGSLWSGAWVLLLCVCVCVCVSMPIFPVGGHGREVAFGACHCRGHHDLWAKTRGIV